MPRPLSHIRVLDLTRVLVGLWGAQNFADLGAEVIKIERPGTEDDTRAWGPPWWQNGDDRETHESAYFLSVNRGEKSVTLDLSRPEGKRLRPRQRSTQERRQERSRWASEYARAC